MPIVPTRAPSREHRNPVRDQRNLFQPVGDVDDPHPLIPQILDDGKEFFDLPGSQNGCRFIQDQDLGLFAQGLGDLDHLFFGDPQVADDGVGVDVHVEALQEAVGITVHPFPVDQPALALLLSQEDVFRHRQGRNQIEFLVDRAYSQLQRLQRRTDIRFLPIDINFSAVLLIEAGEDLDQGRLAGPVFPQQDVDLSGVEIEIHVVQSQYAGELFADPFRLDQDRSCILCHLPHLQGTDKNCIDANVH